MHGAMHDDAFLIEIHTGDMADEYLERNADNSLTKRPVEDGPYR